MNKTIKTQRVARSKARNYLKKAGEYRNGMENHFENREWNGCVLSAIHCAISSIDALTVFILEKRHTGKKHLDALDLLKQTELDRDELNKRSKQFAFLLSIKNIAEYEDRLMNRKDAENGRKACNRIFAWVEGELPDSDPE